MNELLNKKIRPEVAESGQKTSTKQDDDPCRCKQVAVMTPKQLLGTMLKDLAFWKREKKK